MCLARFINLILSEWFSSDYTIFLTNKIKNIENILCKKTIYYENEQEDKQVYSEILYDNLIRDHGISLLN